MTSKIRETHYILNLNLSGMKYAQVIESYQIRQRAHLLLQLYLRVSHACLSPSMLSEPSCDRSWTQLSPKMNPVSTYMASNFPFTDKAHWILVVTSRELQEGVQFKFAM